MRLKKIDAYNKSPLVWIAGRKEERRKRVRFRVLLVLFLLLGAGAGLVYWYWQRQWVITLGRVVAVQLHVAAPFRGRIVLLSPKEGEQVVEGQILAKLHDDELAAAVKRTQALWEEARWRLQSWQKAGLDPAVLAGLERALRDLDVSRERQQRALAEVAQADVLRERTQTIAERTERLFLLRAITRDQWERTVADSRKAQADHTAAQAKLSEERAAVHGAEKMLESAEKVLQYSKQRWQDEATRLQIDVARAEAELEVVESRLGQTVIRAPRDGVVSSVLRKAGEVVDHNDVIIKLMDRREMWIETYVSGSDIGGLREGLEVEIELQGLPEPRHKGRVSVIYAAETAEDRITSVGPRRARSPSQLADLIHTVKISLDTIPVGLRPEMIARVRIARQ